jgi:hypothetical protein
MENRELFTIRQRACDPQDYEMVFPYGALTRKVGLSYERNTHKI